ncbi:uncharacterized methyltransferase C25B8.09-like isoform X1 [Dendronephthya gigantea]|uniref:uncharacterized methyltransferase C25B8.09-like isoform X1 n=1 Tax=Dendronephthya gigantea TaxID=151771 RepID=UPI00106D6224|nr:uncharacterized methyltransferase C25B8.09-like isoform X1 [Dendronephthya gigantea]
MVYWLSKLSLSFKYNVSLTTLVKNLNFRGFKIRNFRLSRMDSVNEAARGWANPEISNIYEKTRPNYNPDSVEFLLEKTGALKPHSGPEPFTIVELGAGTGKFTRAALKVLESRKVDNYKIIATEPLKEMCETFAKMVPNVEIMQCPASDLSGFATNSADAILAAMSFHWFYSNQKAIEEIHRILKPKAVLGLIWYMPDRSVSWIRNIEKALDPRFKAANQVYSYEEKVVIPLRDHAGFTNEGFNLTDFTYAQEFNLQGLLERYKSVSVVSSAKMDEKELILGMIEKEMKINPDVKNKQEYTFKYKMMIHWFEKV